MNSSIIPTFRPSSYTATFDHGAKIAAQAGRSPKKGTLITWMFWAAVIASFMGTVLGVRTGDILWFPLRIFTLAYLPFLLLRRTRHYSGLTRFVPWFLAFMMAYGFTSLLWSPDAALGLRSAGILLTGLLLVTIVIRHFRDRRTLDVIMLIWSVTAIGTSLLGLYETYSGSYLFEGDITKLSSIERVVNQIGWLCPRVFSINWNNFAFTNALSALVLVGWSLEARGKRKMLAGGGAVLSMALVLLSYSRAAVLGMMTGLTVFALCIVTSSATTRRTKAVVIALIVVMSIWIIVINPEMVLQSNIGEAMLNKYQSADNSMRIYYYSQGIQAAIDSLGFGMGLGSSTEVIDGGSYHSFVIEILAELGVWVFLVLCILFIRIGVLLLRAVWTQGGTYWNSALLASCVAFPILQFGPSSIIGEGIFWLWLGVMAAHVGLISGTMKRTPERY